MNTRGAMGLLAKSACLGLGLLLGGVLSAMAQSATVPPGAGTEADPYRISVLSHLVWMGDTVGSSSGKYYSVQNDIDATPTAAWHSGAGFVPIGNAISVFMGTFNGNGRRLRNLGINRTDTDNVGLFGYVSQEGVVEGIHLEGGAVTGRYGVGLLAGYFKGTMRKCSGSGVVTGAGSTGGLVGTNKGSLTGCHATGSSTGGGHTGGLIGDNKGGVSNCFAMGSVTMTGGGYSGGLIGNNQSGTVIQCHASGSVTGGNYTGGLVGDNLNSFVSESFATGSVVGNDGVGGLAGGSGLNTGSSGTTVRASYATGAVTSKRYVGGLVGDNYGGHVSECYAVGQVTGVSNVGGILGNNVYGEPSTNCFWDTTTTGQATSEGGGTGVSTAEMKQQSTFVGWDFAAVWRITEGATYPFFGVAATPPSGAGSAGDPYRISTLSHLVWMGETVGASSGKYYAVQNDIDASTTAMWNDGAGFAPIGNGTAPFAGRCDGNDRILSDLVIHRPGENYAGLFGMVATNGQVSRIVMEGGMVEGLNYVASLAGMNKGAISDCRASASALGNNFYVGGLVGINYGVVRDCRASGPAAGSWYIGGLIGDHVEGGTVSRSYATGSATGSIYIGGLIGYAYGSVNNCYATGSAIGSEYVGGLIGVYQFVGVSSNCYSTGLVTGTYRFGGIVGYVADGSVTNFYWDTTTSGMTTSAGGAGRSTAQMLQKANYSGWDFIRTWDIEEGLSYPYFKVKGNGVGDYDGDGQTDMAVFDIAGGYWYIRTLAGGVVSWADQWGWSTAWPVVGDYNGDGIWDQAVFDTAGGYWYIKTLNGTVISWANQWGWSTAKPVPGDYNGDGTWDQAVFDTAGGYWYIKTLSGTVISWANQWGWSTAKPVSGDFDGDGIYDLAVYDTAQNLWYIKSLDGRVLAWGVQWGFPGCRRPTLGD